MIGQMVVIGGDEIEGGKPTSEASMVLEAAVGWPVAVTPLLSHLDLPDPCCHLPICCELELGSVRGQISNVNIDCML